MASARRVVAQTAIAALALTAGLAPAQEQREFPQPDEPDIRVGTPNDPDFDCAEDDDEDGGGCEGDLYAEQFRLFGFAPDLTEDTALYRDPGRSGQPQISGVKADAAWKTTVGSPAVTVAVMDTGIRWDDEDVRTKVRLNRGELPCPQDAQGETAAGEDCHDRNGDGVFNVTDYADDERVGRRLADGRITAGDLIDAFSDGSDEDDNGYVDDIAGWDFFEDDNDPEDTTSYSSARNHGTGRMEEAAEVTHDARGEAGICPDCRILPMRIWDTFVTPADTWAAATVYATDAGAQVHLAAIGMLQNSRTAKAANRYAYDNGVALMHVSSDLNTANHNYPTNYAESVFINGCVSDTFGGSNEIFGEADPRDLPGVGEALDPLLDALVPGAVTAPVFTWFRQSNLTQHGAHAHVCYVGDTGSNATGQAGGGAGLIHSRGIEAADTIGGPLSANEVKQILTLEAEDVLAENTVGVGAADPAQEGWDERFGYGRADLGAAVERVAANKIPPEALIRRPAWWHILDPEGVGPDSSDYTLRGTARAPRADTCSYTLEWAAGIEPPDDGFTAFAQGSCPAGRDAVLGELPMDAIADAVPGARTADFGSGRPDPNRFAFTVRLVVEDGQGNRGEDRKAYFAVHDPSWHAGWPRFPDTGGETSLTLYDLNGDGNLEIVDATSSGELCVYREDGTFAPFFNGGACWRLPPTFFHHPQAPGFASGEVPPPTSGLRTPAIADLNGDFRPEIVAVAGDGRVFVLQADGGVRLELGIDPANSTPDKRDSVNHPKRGVLGSPVAADLDGDGTKEIVLAALDGFLYAWDGATGHAKPGFPLEVREDPAPPGLEARGELITAPAIGDITGDGEPEIVIGSSDVVFNDPAFPDGIPDLSAGINALVGELLSNGVGGESRVYAYHADGTPVAGWPVPIPGLLPDVLPLVGPQHAVALADTDGDGVDEVVTSITTGDVHIFEGDTSRTVLTSQGVVTGGAVPEPTRVLNLFENVTVADLDDAPGLDIAKVGITAPGVLNLLLVGQNLPFNHVVQAWNTSAPELYRPGYPTAHDDYGLLSQPAAADVDGSGTRELIAGSGLYLIQAYDTSGQSAPGFPKFAGGWLFGVPAVGDIDADGELELAATTREGWRLVWDLDAPSTIAANSEWWTEGHDECRTWRYGTDCRPPSPVQHARFDEDELVFIAPGDNFMTGRVDRYELRTAAAPIETADDWRAARSLESRTPTVDARLQERLAVDTDAVERFLAVQPVDAAGNRARFVSVVTGPGAGDPGPPDDPGPPANTGSGGSGGGCTLGEGRDAGLPLLLLAAALAAVGRRRRGARIAGR